MSTHATVVVKIPQDKREKTYCFRNDIKQDYKTPNTVISKTTNYISIYIHFDGYIDGLGEELMSKYDNFEALMEEVICGGDASCIGTPYHAWRDEDWNHVMPKQSGSLPNRTEDYQYLFDDGEWYVRSYESDEFKKITDNTPNIEKKYQKLKVSLAMLNDNMVIVKEHMKNIEKNIEEIKKEIDNV